jgi:hypothetical protein
MHAVIMSRQLMDILRGEKNLGYNLGPYIGRPISGADP